MHKQCTIYRTANFIGKRWTLLILLELYKGKAEWKRYYELKSRLGGITPKILSSRLKELEKEGLIAKKISAKSFPVKCEYSLTKTGKDFIGIIKNLKKWALKWKLGSEMCRNAKCKDCEL